jgi:hypothetical protein
MQALKQAVVFVFRRGSETALSEDAFVRQVSLDLHWFSPKDARRFLDAARALGYLKQGPSPGLVQPTFDLSEVEVRLDFRVDARALEGAPQGQARSVAEELVARAAALQGAAVDEVWARVARKKTLKLLDTPAAAALVAAEAGVDLKPYFARVREELARLSKTPSPSAA